MRTALDVAGALFLSLSATAALAAEGSSLRGLKVPGSASVAGLQSAGEPLLRGGPLDGVPDGGRAWFDGYSVDSQSAAVGPLQLRSTLHQPIGQNISSLADTHANALYEPLPRFTLFSQVNRSLPGGWGLGLGVRQNEYSYVTTNLVSFSAEHAWGNLRGGYTLYSSRADGSGLGSAHRLQVSYAYGERNSVGLAYTVGRDVDNPALTLGMPLADVRDWSLSGRHWLSPNWALTYDVLSQEHAYLNRRQGLRLGVSRSF